MALPIRTTLDDVQDLCAYFAKKPTGATIRDAKTVLDAKRVDGRKLSALKSWGLLEEDGERLRVTEPGRRFAKGEERARAGVLAEVIREVKPYAAIVERAHHRTEDSLSAIDVAAHWHLHFADEVANSDKVLNDQAVCFFQVAQGAGLGTLVIGRKGAPTRFEFDRRAVSGFVDGGSPAEPLKDMNSFSDGEDESTGDTDQQAVNPPERSATLGQGIFIAHGKDKKALNQLKRILDQFKVPYKVATDEPHLGRPISQKVRETMQACNCAILVFTADEELQSKGGETIWRPSENVVYELGAAGYLYDKRIVILKEEGVTFPSNFNDLGYISFSKDQLEAKAMDVLSELIGFGIVKVTT